MEWKQRANELSLCAAQPATLWKDLVDHSNFFIQSRISSLRDRLESRSVSGIDALYLFQEIAAVDDVIELDRFRGRFVGFWW